VEMNGLEEQADKAKARKLFWKPLSWLGTIRPTSRMILSNAPRCAMFMRPHGMTVTGIDCIHMTGIGRTFTGYLNSIEA
jgi:hypothetical protein